MQDFFSLLQSYPFMQNALAASFLASIACGIVGTLIICNRLTFLAGGASHAAYGGIGIAFHWGLPILPCTIIFTVLASLLMGIVTLRGEKQGKTSDTEQGTSIAVLWAAGMALGIILIDITPGYAGELMGFLFGSILSVPSEDLLLMLAFDIILCLLLALFYQGLWALSLDREFARARGLPVDSLFLLLIGLSAVTSVLLIRIVGLILILALLTIPPFVARRFCKTMHGTMLVAVLFSLVICLSGLALSWKLDISSGPATIAVGVIMYFLSLLLPKKALRH